MSKTNKTRYILGIAVFFVLSVSFIRSTFHVFKSKDRLDEVNQEVAMLERERSQIEKDIEYCKSDEYIEEKARNELNLIKPGELVYVVSGGDIENKESSDVLAGSDVKVEDEKDANWYSWYRLFFDN